MNMTSIPTRLKKIKEKSSRTSLTVIFALFVFLILLAAIGLSALLLYILAKSGAIASADGELALGTTVLLMTTTSIVIGVGLSFLSMKLPLKPINNLINKLNLLASGDFSVRISLGATLSAHPVFREIAESFNKMAEELESTELLRSDFINNLSHEFKTPLVSITGLAKLLSRGNLSDEERALYLRAIEEEAIRLSDMASNVLNLTRVENQSILTEVSRFNVSEQIRSSLLLLEERWSEKEIELELELDEYYIEANEELLKQVWINLIDNAIKFSPKGATLAVEAEKSEGTLLFRISNTGSEIPKDKQTKIFNKFYQADESHSTAGNGIGLAIVKRIVALHGGEVGVVSENNTTQFFVRLPITQ